MSTEFFSQASNFQSSAAGSVDPRTGLFNYMMPVAHLIGNNQLGPELTLALAYSPLNSADIGFGLGFSLGLTHYDSNTKMLMVSTGERYKVEETDKKVTLTQYKQDVVRFEKEVDQDIYRVIHKSGQVEILTGPKNAFNLKVPVQIINPLGYRLHLEWDYTVGAVPHLTGVYDLDKQHRALLTVNTKPGVATRLSVWPGTPEAYEIELALHNGRVSTITNLTAGQTLIWSLDYDQQCQFLNRVSTPTGSLEVVTYIQDGHHFPAKGPATTLPYVTEYSQFSGQNDAIVRTYLYTKNNFLGSGTGGNWSQNQDYLYGVLSDYQYGSTERWDNGREVREITRRYNNYHLLISEEVNQNGCRRQHETEYYAKIAVDFDEQPAQFQLPKSATLRFISGNGQREEVTRTEFDTAGNPTLQIAPDGTRTEWVYYPAEGELSSPDDYYGCPADPHGFVRYVKSKTVTPGAASPAGAYEDAPGHKVTYRYEFLPTLPGTATPLAVVRTHQCLFRLDRQAKNQQCQLLHVHRTRYISKPGSPHYGRVGHLKQTVYDGEKAGQCCIQRQVFHYKLDKYYLKQTTDWTSDHDGLTASRVQTHSCFSHRVRFEQDHQGCTALYEYDAFGRLQKQLNNAGTAYARDIEYAYAIEQRGQVATTQRDVLNNRSRTWFDGQGRRCKQAILLKGWENADWLTVAETARDNWGRVVRQTRHDWLPTGDDPDKTDLISVSVQTDYDDWGQAHIITDATGQRSVQDYDPVTRIARHTTQAGNLKFSTTETRYNVRHQPLTVTLLDSQGTPVSWQNHWYDGLGRLRATLDMQDKKTEYTYDAFNRVSAIRYSDGTVVRKTYAPFSSGNLVVKIEVDGTVLGERVFDSLGRVTSSTVGGRTQTAIYEGSSPVPETVTDPLGQTVKTQSEPRLGNVPTCVEAPGLTQKFTYDGRSGAITQSEAVGQATLQRTYTPAGQLKEETVKFDDAGAGPARSAVYHYSPTGQMTACQDMAGVSHRLRFDGLGRPVESVDKAVTVTLHYDAAGRTDRWTVRDNVAGQQLMTTLTFDDFSRETGRRIESGTDVLTLSQTYTLIGQLASRTMDSPQAGRLREEHYTYDADRHWLTDYRCSGTECPRDAYGQTLSRQQFTYDRLGNLLTCLTTLADGSQDTARFSYANPADPCQLTKMTHSHPGYPATIVLTYDKAGRLIADEANRMLAYDGLGRLASVTQGNSTQTYGYDASGRLALQLRGQADTRELYYHGASRVAEIQRESGAVTRQVQAGSAPAASVTDDGVHLLGTDGPGSVLLSRRQGTASRFRYTPYGQQAAADCDPDLPGYNGERQDPAGGGYHLGNGYRTYNPVLMRFTAPDSLSPFGAGGLNAYAYCLGDPINRTDPSGHMSSIVGIVLGVFGMVAELATVIPTGGASLTLGGAIMAGIGFLGAATGVASSLTEESSPQASAILSWVSMGFGAVSLGSSVLGKLARYTRQASVSHMLTAETAETAETTETAEVPERVAVSGPPSPTIINVLPLNMAAPLPPASNASDAFDRAVSAGWIQEVQTQVQAQFTTHSLELRLPQAPNVGPRMVASTENPFLQRLSFDTSLPVSRMNNAVPNSVIHVDITIPVARTLYAPFINGSTNQVGVGFINYIRHDIGVRQILAAENRITGTQHMVEYQQSVISAIEDNWNNVRLSGNPRGLMQAIIQHQIPQIWRQFCTSGLDVFAFYNQHIFI